MYNHPLYALIKKMGLVYFCLFRWPASGQEEVNIFFPIFFAASGRGEQKIFFAELLLFF
jgi:hypothetical protein